MSLHGLELQGDVRDIWSGSKTRCKFPKKFCWVPLSLAEHKPPAAKSDVAGNFSAGWKVAWGGCDLLFPVVSRGLGMLPCVWPHWGRLQSIRAGGKKTRCLPACNQNGYTPITGLCGILQFLLLSEKPPFLLSLFKNANENVTDFSQLWRAEAAGCAVVHGWGRQRGETVAHFQKQGVKSMGYEVHDSLTTCYLALRQFKFI